MTAEAAIEWLSNQLQEFTDTPARPAGLMAADLVREVLRIADTPPATAAGPDSPCTHPDFHANVDVNRIGEGDPASSSRPRAFMCDVRVNCTACGEAFRFMGVPAGMSFTAPAVSVDEKEIHLPVRPASADPDFGMGIPGFAIRQSYRGPS